MNGLSRSQRQSDILAGDRSDASRDGPMDAGEEAAGECAVHRALKARSEIKVFSGRRGTRP